MTLKNKNKITTNNYQQLNLKKQQRQKQTKQTIRTRTELQKWRSFGALSAGRGKGKNGGKGTGNKKHNLVDTK